MKKLLVISMASLVAAIAPVFNAMATGINTTDDSSHDVTVGEADEPIYSVNIYWGDLSFDWKYDESKSNFSFAPHYDCVSTSYDLENHKTANNLYSDTSCKELYTGTVTEGQGNYYYTEPKSYIQVGDKSINGKIKATASFTSVEKYNWVSGIFGKETDQYLGPNTTVQNAEFQVYTDGVLPNISTVCNPYDGCTEIYGGILKLETSESPMGSHVVTSGDKIGTVTITIEADLN